jgi:hypothetical protein
MGEDANVRPAAARKLSASALMLLGIDRFVTVTDHGIGVICTDRHVQSWLCGEALLGGALWALWEDGALSFTVEQRRHAVIGAERPTAVVQRQTRLDYPSNSLEARLLEALSDRPEAAVDALKATIGKVHGQPWQNIMLVAFHEIVDAGYVSWRPLEGSGAKGWFVRRMAKKIDVPGEPVPDCRRLSALAPEIDRLIARWDVRWSGNDEALVALGRACHDAIVGRRIDLISVRGAGTGAGGVRGADEEEEWMSQARPSCPRWARSI